MIAELRKELPAEEYPPGVPEEVVLEEVIFRKIGLEKSEADHLKNEQVKHRNTVLQMFLDFELLGVSTNQRTAKIIQAALAGFLTRTVQDKRSQKSNSKAARSNERLQDCRA